MNNRKWYYARVSSVGQNLDRQLEAFRNMGADERDIIIDKKSGANLEREGYQALRSTILRQGDTLVIKSLDRLSRTKKDIKEELEWLKSNQIRLMIIDVPSTMVEISCGQEWILDMINNILIEVLSSIAEQERTMIKQRQREGIDAAKKKGKYLGRPRALYPDNWEEIYKKYEIREISAKKAIEQLNLKRSTFYKLLNMYKRNGK